MSRKIHKNVNIHFPPIRILYDKSKKLTITIQKPISEYA